MYTTVLKVGGCAVDTVRRLTNTEKQLSALLLPSEPRREGDLIFNSSEEWTGNYQLSTYCVLGTPVFSHAVGHQDP